MFLTSPNLASITHGFFTRKGGVSSGLYASLNCGWGTEDSLTNVIENRERVARALGTNGINLLSLYQIHGDKVITVDAPWQPEAKPQADAMVTTQPGIALGILTADCVPVLLADPENRVIAAAHMGWKGALAGVLAHTARAMCALGAKPTSLRAAIGPCIAQQSYEVDASFRDRFLRLNTTFAAFFIPGNRAGRFLFDIRACAHALLLNERINNINTLENDTYIEEYDFFSFRRATHRSEPDYGRQISAIML